MSETDQNEIKENKSLLFPHPTCKSLYVVGEVLYIDGIKHHGDFVDMSYYWGGEFSRIPVLTLKAVCYFNIQIPVKFYKYINVRFLDGDSKNENFDNLYYDFGGGLLETDLKGFYYIPYLTCYCVNLEGDVRTISGMYITKNVYQNPKDCKTPEYGNYIHYRLICDFHRRRFKYNDFSYNTSKQIGRYRVLSLVFLRYPTSPFMLDVNHIDGFRNHDRIENLEWVTRQGNCHHAYRNGLRSDNIPTLVKDYFKNTVEEYHSISAAGLSIGVDDETVRYKLYKNPNKLYRGRFLFRRKDELETNPWPSYEDLNKNGGVRRLICTYNVFTKEHQTYLGMVELQESLGFTTKDVHLAKFILEQQKKFGKLFRPLLGYHFKYINEDLKIPHHEYSVYELEYFRKLATVMSSNAGFVVFKDGNYLETVAGNKQAATCSGVSFYTIANKCTGKDYFFVNVGDTKYEFYRIYSGNFLERTEVFKDLLAKSHL